MKFNREKNHVQKYKLYFYTNSDNLINNTKKTQVNLTYLHFKYLSRK
jgi:hypothetical protein